MVTRSLYYGGLGRWYFRIRAIMISFEVRHDELNRANIRELYNEGVQIAFRYY